MKRSIDNDTKEIIIQRLYDHVGICGVCHKKDCRHENRVLPHTVSIDEILRAINLGEYYFQEPSG